VLKQLRDCFAAASWQEQLPSVEPPVEGQLDRMIQMTIERLQDEKRIIHERVSHCGAAGAPHAIDRSPAAATA
jgi:hypothetical protein